MDLTEKFDQGYLMQDEMNATKSGKDIDAIDVYDTYMQR